MEFAEKAKEMAEEWNLLKRQKKWLKNGIC